MRKMIKVLYYEPSTGFGGSSRCLYEWLRHLNGKEFAPFVITHFNGPAIKRIKALNVKVAWIPYLAILKKLSLITQGGSAFSYLIFSLEFLFNIIPVAFFLTGLILLKKIDLVDVNTSISTGIPAILAAFVTKRPCVCHIHDTRNLTRKEVFFAKFVDTFFVLTPKGMELYRIQLPAKKIVVLPNGIDVKEKLNLGETLKVTDEFQMKNGHPIVGVVGRITKGKGHDDFLKAAKIVVGIYPQTKFFIVGGPVLTDQEYEKQIIRMAEKEGLDDNVVFTGWRNDAKEIMSIFDVLVVPTSTFPEGFNLTCIEAMALGKPIVATNVTGPSEIVLDNVSGFLVPPSSPVALAEKINTLIKDRVLAKEMGRLGRKRIEEHFNIEQITSFLEKEYLVTISSKGKTVAYA